MPLLPQIVYHDTSTSRSGYQYMFTPKHHGADRSAAQWLPELTLDEEFAVFNSADDLQIADAEGNLYGVEKVGEDDLRILGTRGEQVAKFPFTRANQYWHGYPSWPLVGTNLVVPAKEALDLMKERGLVTKRGRKRLGKGDPV